MKGTALKEAKSLIEEGKVDEAIEILEARLEPTMTVFPHFFGLLTDYRSLPNSVATALRRNDLSGLNSHDLMEALSFVRNTIKRTTKSNFLTSTAVIALHNIEKEIQQYIEEGEV